MKKIFLAVLVLLQAGIVSARNVKMIPLDQSLLSAMPKENEIYYGWKMYSWTDWLRRPSSGPLMVPGDYGKRPLEVFEAHSAGIVKKPASTFTKEYLQNIATIRRLDPANQHELVNAAPFTVQTVIQFPATWAKIIMAAKNANVLDADSAPYIEMKSVFAYANQQGIESNPQLQRILGLLDENAPLPAAINIQAIVKANQIAQFGSIVTLFYDLGGQKTLVVNYFALALKKRILDLGVTAFDSNLTGRSVLLGQNAVLNTDSGIGAGLPNFALEFFEQMLQGM